MFFWVRRWPVIGRRRLLIKGGHFFLFLFYFLYFFRRRLANKWLPGWLFCFFVGFVCLFFFRLVLPMLPSFIFNDAAILCLHFVRKKPKNKSTKSTLLVGLFFFTVVGVRVLRRSRKTPRKRKSNQIECNRIKSNEMRRNGTPGAVRIFDAVANHWSVFFFISVPFWWHFFLVDWL